MKTIIKDKVGKHQTKDKNKSYYNILQSDDDEDNEKEELLQQLIESHDTQE